ncbi:hypothetical protein ES703_101372 [subsurface metagenome]
MHNRPGTRAPAKLGIEVDKSGAVGRAGITSSWADEREAPNQAFDYRAVGLNLIDPPVVSRARNKTFGIRSAGKTGENGLCGLVASERAAGAVIYISKIVAEVQIVRDCTSSSHPTKGYPVLVIIAAIRRDGIGGDLACGITDQTQHQNKRK